MQVLDLSNLRTTTRDTVCINIEQLQQGCPKLRVLRLTNSLVRLSPTPLKDQAASSGFPHLEELSIAVDPKNYTSLDNAAMERILKSAHKLRLLDVRGCSSITNSSLVRVPAWDLEHLFLSGKVTFLISFLFLILMPSPLPLQVVLPRANQLTAWS